MNQPTALQAVDVSRDVRVGQPAVFTIRSGSEPSIWCGLRVNFGDGEIRDIKVGSDKKLFPVVLDKTYKTAGRFEFKAVGVKVTTHPACPGTVSAQVQVGGGPVAAAATPVAPVAVAGPDAQAALCPEVVPIRNASGETVSFGLRQMVRDAGGLPAAREQVARRIIEAQERALDDKLPATDRDAAKRFADSLKIVRDQLARCT